MLTVIVFCSLVVATVTDSQTTVSSDKRQQHISLVPSLLRLERTLALLSAKLESNTDRLTTKLESNTARLTTKLRKNTADISSMKSELRDKDAQLLGFTRSLAQLKTDVAFEASLAPGKALANVNDDVLFKFSNVMYNRGGGYRKSSGIFTAPVSGTYLFWAHIMNGGSSKGINVYIYKDGVIVGRGFTTGSIPGGVASVSTVTSLKKGDQVWLLKRGSSSLRGENLSSYGGALLRAL